jgi:uncharacterized protein
MVKSKNNKKFSFISKSIFSKFKKNILYLLIILLFSTCSAYYPTNKLVGNPSMAGLKYKDLFIKTQDNETLHAWYIPKKNHKGVILFSHGNGGNISHRLSSLQIFHKLGYSTLIYDYRGYGKSSGKPSEIGTYVDISTAWNFLVLKKGFFPKDIIIFGRSLGGGISSWLAIKTNPRAVILESTFTSVPDLASDMYWWLPGRYFVKQNYNTLKRIHKIKSPLLIIHSKTDGLIPYSHALKNFKKAKCKKTFLTIKGKHNGGYIISGEVYTNGIDNFLKNIK